jgi:glyoxylase I family protein
MLHGRPLHHMALVVEDLVRAEKFYVEVLGLKVARRWDDSQGALRSVWMHLGDDGVLMLERGIKNSVDHGGWHLMALRIRADERSAMESALTAAGVAITGKTAYTLYFEDPEGNRWGLSHWPDPAA